VTERVDIVSVLQRHFDACMEMLAGVIDRCPESLWAEAENGSPIWQHIYHTLVGPHFWFRETQDEGFVYLTFDKEVSPDLGKQTAAFLTRDELRQYVSRTREICGDFFDGIDVNDPLETSGLAEVFTKTDLVLMQIRHFQHHVGYCNGILRARGVDGAPWLGYGE